MRNVLRHYFYATVIIALFLCPALKAAELTYTLADYSQTDSLSRRAQLVLGGDWQYKTNESDPWKHIQVPVPFRLRDIFILKKQFALDSSMSAQQYEMEFQGIDGPCTVHLNKRIVGTHSAGTSPFRISLKRDELFFNEPNELILQVDTRLDNRKSLPMLTRNRGIPAAGDGIFRPIILRTGLAPYVSEVTVKTLDGIGVLQGTLQSTIQLGGSDSLARAWMQSSGPLRGQVEILDGQTSQPLFSSPALPLLVTEQDSARLEIDFSLSGFSYWQPRQPNHYLLKLQLYQGVEIVDRVMLPFALSQPQAWFGKSRVFQGDFRYQIVEWIEDVSFRFLSAEEQRSAIEKDLAEIYELGANMVRVPGNAPAPHFLELCDKQGLGVLLEIPVTNIPSEHLANAAVRLSAKKSLQSLITAYRSHPSVAAWGLGSGFDGGDVNTEHFLKELAVEARKLDDRPLYAGVRGKGPGFQKLPVDFQILEVPPEKLPEISQWYRTVQGFYILQFISPLPSLVGDTRSGQMSQAFYLKAAFQEAKQRQGALGISVSPFRDWSGDAPHAYWGPREKSNCFTAGLIDANGQQRMVYEVVKAAFTHATMPELLPGDIPAADPAVFQIVGIVLIVILLYFIRRDKRMSNYMRRVFVYSHGFYVDLNENRQVNPFLTGLIGMASFLTLATILASFVYFVRDNSLFDEILTWFFPDANAKNQAISLIWHPERLVLFFTGVLLGLAFLQSIVYKLFVIGQRRYLRFSQIVTFVLWVPANFIFALPLAVVLFRALSRSSLVTISLFYFLIMILWFLLRSVRGAKVIMQVSAGKAILLQLAGLALVLLVIGLYLEQSRALLAYAAYYWSLLEL